VLLYKSPLEKEDRAILSPLEKGGKPQAGGLKTQSFILDLILRPDALVWTPPCQPVYRPWMAGRLYIKEDRANLSPLEKGGQADSIK
jgi:hypothetical protein